MASGPQSAFRGTSVPPPERKTLGVDPKRLVSEGYDRIHLTYERWGDQDGLRQRYVTEVLDRRLVVPDGDALDLGCGTGVLGTAQLVRRFTVVAVDISKESVRVARLRLPGVQLVVADMATVAFRFESFDLVTAFYSLIHVPREEHATVVARISRWLRPGGIAILTMGAGTGGDERAESWLGAPMFWSNWDRETNIRIVRQSGLEVLEARVEVTMEDDQPVSFLWLIARR